MKGKAKVNGLFDPVNSLNRIKLKETDLQKIYSYVILTQSTIHFSHDQF